MIKRIAVSALFLIMLSSSIYAYSISDSGGYMSLSGGTDLGWSIGDDGIRSNYATIGVDFVCYICKYIGLSYGAGLNVPFSVYYHNEKAENKTSFIPIEVALRASMIGRYPISDKASICARLGLVFYGGKCRYSSDSYTGIDGPVKRTTERMDVALGLFSELSLSESFCFIAGADVLFPVYAAIRESGIATSSSRKSSYDYKRYGVYPYIGFALFA